MVHTKNSYTIEDVKNTGYLLKPIKYKFCGSLEVEYLQYIGDGICQECGECQTEYK